MTKKLRELFWYGSFGSSGYGNVARKLVTILMNSKKYMVKIKTYGKPLKRTNYLYNLQNIEVNNPIVVWNYIPIRVPKDDFPHPVGYCTAFEINKPPERMIPPLQKSDYVIGIGNHSQKVIRKVVDNKEKVFKHNFPYFPGEFSPDGKSVRFKNIDDDVFKFLFVGRMDIRKNIDTLIKAFSEEFGNNEKVALLLKLTSGSYNPQLFINRYNPSDNVYLLQHYFEDLSELYRSVDAYVCTDFGEGWGGPCTEAMLSGIPTIAPRHSGHLDYMSDDNSWLIDVGDWRYIGYENENRNKDLLPPYRKAKYPIFEDVKTKMRTVYEEFKNLDDSLQHDRVQRALEVQEIVHPKVIYKQLDKCFDWVEENVHRI